MKTNQLTILWLIAILSFSFIGAKADSSLYMFEPKTHHFFMKNDTNKTDPLLDTIIRINELTNNLNRTLDEYDEDTTSEAISKWSDERTVQELIRIYKETLPKRKELAAASGSDLLYQLQTRRLTWMYNNSFSKNDSKYRILLGFIEQSYHRLKYANTVTKETKDALEALLVAEVKSATQEDLDRDALFIVEGCWENNSEMIKSLVPYFEGKDELVVLDLLILKGFYYDNVSPLWQKLNYNSAGSEMEKKWLELDKDVAARYEDLLKRAKGTPYKSRIDEYASTFRLADLKITFENYNSRTGEVTVRVFGAVHNNFDLVRSMDNVEKGKNTDSNMTKLGTVVRSGRIARAEFKDNLEKCGRYLYQTLSNPGKTSVTLEYTYFEHQQMYVKSRYPNNEEVEIFVFDTYDGKPLKDIPVKVYTHKKQFLETLHTDSKGYVSIKRRNTIAFAEISDKRLIGQRSETHIPQIYVTSKSETLSHNIEFYTDRPIYRYGQEVKVGVILYKDYIEGLTIAPNRDGEVVLTAYRDGQQETLAKSAFKSNANGVAELSFTLPDDEAYGGFYLTATAGEYSGSHHVNVKSYKLNHLSVHIDSIPSGYVTDRPLIIYGRVSDLNGNPTPASIILSYDHNNPKARMSYEVGTDGRFVLQTPPIKGGKSSYHNTLIRVDATDPLGNVANAHERRVLRDTNLPLSASLLTDSRRIDKRDIRLSTTGQPYTTLKLGDLTRYSVSAYLTGKGGQRIELGTLPINGEVTLSRPDVKSGAYTLTLTGVDLYGKVVQDSIENIVFYGTEDKVPPVETALWCVREPKTSRLKRQRTSVETVLWCVREMRQEAEAGRDVVFAIGSSYDNYISVEIYNKDNNKLIRHEIIRCNKEIRRYTVPETLLRGSSATVYFSTERNNTRNRIEEEVIGNQTYKEDDLVIKNLPQKERHTPGAKVSRRLMVTDSKGGVQAGVPVFVTVFDKAVLEASGRDLFWKTIASYNYRYDVKIRGAVPYGETAEMMALSENMVMKQAAVDMIQEEEVRSDFSETAYFTVLLTTDERGEVAYEYTLPDTQTKYVEFLYTFTKDLKKQRVERVEYEVYAPLSAEMSVPRYLTISDRLDGQAILRNTEDKALAVTYQILNGDETILSGDTLIPAKGTATVDFRVLPDQRTGDSLILTAKVATEGYKDAVRRKIPLISDMSTYLVAVPFSEYRNPTFTLTLPKVDKANDAPIFEMYLNPLHVVLTRPAQEYAHTRTFKVEDMSIFEILHLYSVYAQIGKYLKDNKAVSVELKKAVPLLRKVAEGRKIDFETFRSDVFFSRRQTDPKTLADFYDFVTDPKQVESFKEQVSRQLLKYLNPDGGFGLDKSYTSVWFTHYVLHCLSSVSRSELDTDLRKATDKAIDFLDAKIMSDHWYRDAISYTVLRHKFRPNMAKMPKGLSALLKKQYDTLATSYRDAWVGRILLFGELTSFYGDKKVDREVQKFINDMSAFTFSDSERLIFEIYKQNRDKGKTAKEIIAFMLQLKQGTIWSKSYTIDAVKCLLTNVVPTVIADGAELRIGTLRHRFSDMERATGHIYLRLDALSPNLHIDLSHGITTDFAFGGVIYEATEPSEEVTPTGEHLKVSKEVFARRVSSAGGESRLIPLSSATPAIKGEKLIVRYTIESDRDISLVSIIDERPAGSEPGYTLRGYGISDRLWWSFLRRESTDLLFIDYLPRGKHVLQLEATANIGGSFIYGPAQVGSYYAPEYQGNSAGGRMDIEIKGARTNLSSGLFDKQNNAIIHQQNNVNSKMATVTLKGNPIQTTGNIPAKGAEAPCFTAVKADLSEVSLCDLKGKRVVLNIFPSVDTGVCAQSVRQFNAKASEVDNTVILCLSKDLPFALGRFCGAEGLDKVVPASLFRNAEFDKAYGLGLVDGPLAGLLARSVIVVDTDGKVLHSELVPEIAQEPNYEAALAVLK